MFWKAAAASVATLMLTGPAALADTISPTSFGADLAVGESATVEKTVLVEASGPTEAVLDVMFVFDTTGSMGGAIDTAKTAAVDILNGLSGFGDLHSGAGQYDDPGFDGVYSDLTASDATTIAAIDDFFACFGSCGGDGPELGWAGIEDAASNASWRPGSNRFIVAFGNSTFKGPPGSAADTTAALGTNNVDLIGLNYGGTGFADEITALGGDVFAGTTDADDIVDTILAAVTAGFSTYSEVTVDDLDGGLPGIDVSTVCTSADTGVCSGAVATGTYDRSTDRTFTFDVTFTRVADGTSIFDTFALVDGGIVASESDRFTVDGGPVIPVPAAAWLLLGGLGGLGALRGMRRG